MLGGVLERRREPRGLASVPQIAGASAACSLRSGSVVHVGLLGDSQLTDTSPRRDVTKLGPRLRRRGHEVETLAVGGLDTRSALTLPYSTRPADWTVYCFGANDAAPWKRMPPPEFAANLELLVQQATSHHLLVLAPAPVHESGEPGSGTNREADHYSTIAAAVAAATAPSSSLSPTSSRRRPRRRWGPPERSRLRHPRASRRRHHGPGVRRNRLTTPHSRCAAHPGSPCRRTSQHRQTCLPTIGLECRAA